MVAYLFLSAGLLLSLVNAQPSPDVQRRISAAIKNAATATPPLDYTAFVNPFIGTDNDGDVCPGASIPFGMVKFSTDLTGYAPAGYIANPAEKIRGISPLHDSGTGSSLGTYGNFEIMPLLCPNGFDTCTTRLLARERLRKLRTDVASPGYFAQTLDNNILMEATATRRAGLERFTFPRGKPYFVLDLANDLPNSFAGGTLDIDPTKGRVTIGGRYGSSFGPGRFNYQAVRVLRSARWRQADFERVCFGLDAKGLGQTHLNLTLNLIGGVYQSGALFSYDGNPKQINIRVGVSFVSTDQACANAESEVGSSTFEEIQAQAKALWNEKLSKIEIDMLYSSLYRASLTPNNATGETQGLFAGTTSFYFDSLYCSWDTFRTFYPLLSLYSPEEYAQIVDTYIDGWRKNGWMPECMPGEQPAWLDAGWFQCGHHRRSFCHPLPQLRPERLGIDLEELYSAGLDGRRGQSTRVEYSRPAVQRVQYGYVPFAVLDVSSTGRQTREGSRTLEVTNSMPLRTFGIRQIAQLLGKTDDEAKFTNRSLSYRNVWDPSVVTAGFMQKRYPNGKFNFTDPVACSPNDPNTTECSLQSDNTNGVRGALKTSAQLNYSCSFMSRQAGSTAGLRLTTQAHLIEDTFIKRLDHFFDAGYYLAGNEPSFQTPIGYHYANRPAKSVDRVREVVFSNFDIIPSATQYLILSPFTPKASTRKSVQKVIPAGVAAYVKNVTINGVPSASRCHFDFYDVFRVGGNVTIELTADKAEANDCLGALPESLSTGGFAAAR
ncbi:glycoside hydrolase family 92 protein [Mycena rebaudengoi]|nr:glycoside hydrolase family 92 protein [Mycena rebaudengoi]